MAPKANSYDPSALKILPSPEGLPDGWIMVEKKYLSGPKAGDTYPRFQTADGRHRNTCTIKQAIKITAQEAGRDPDLALAEYEEWKRGDDARKKAAREQAVIDKAEARERHINLYRLKYGELDGMTTRNFPGWQTDHIYLETCDQTHVVYTTPEGDTWRILKEIEAWLGGRMEAGEDISAFVQAGKTGTNILGFGEAATEAKRRHQEAVARGEKPPTDPPRARAPAKKRRRRGQGTDSEVEAMEPGDAPRDGAAPGYRLLECRGGAGWAVLPDDVVSVDLEAVGGRIERSGWMRAERREAKHVFDGVFEKLPPLHLYAGGGRLLVRSFHRLVAERIATALVNDWLMEGADSAEEE